MSGDSTTDRDERAHSRAASSKETIESGVPGFKNARRVVKVVEPIRSKTRQPGERFVELEARRKASAAKAGTKTHEAINALLREAYGENLAVDLATRAPLFDFYAHMPPMPRWRRVLQRLRWKARAPFRWLAYGFAWLGGIDLESNDD